MGMLSKLRPGAFTKLTFIYSTLVSIGLLLFTIFITGSGGWEYFLLVGGGIWLVLVVWQEIFPEKLFKYINKIQSLRVFWSLIPILGGMEARMTMTEWDFPALTARFAIMVLGGASLKAWELSVLTLFTAVEYFWGHSGFLTDWYYLSNFLASLTVGWLIFSIVIVVRRAQTTEEQLAYQYERDELTGLWSRMKLIQEMSVLINLDKTFVIVLAHCYNYRELTKFLGTAIGDAVLCSFSDYLQDEAGKDNMVARMTEDELILLFPYNIEVGPLLAKLEEGQRHLRFELEEGALPVYAEFGWASYPLDGTNISELIRQADRRRIENIYSNYPYRWKYTDLFKRHDPPEPERSLFEALSGKDVYTRVHSQAVAEYLIAFAKYLKLDIEEDNLWRAGILHDIGKVAIPDRFLKKPGHLSEEEYLIIKQHPIYGESLVHRWIGENTIVLSAIMEHHERWDGTGYPLGKKDIEISNYGRMLAIIDAYSAMTLDRSYHKGRTPKEAVAEILRCAGGQFDPNLAEKFAAMMEEWGYPETVSGHFQFAGN